MKNEEEYQKNLAQISAIPKEKILIPPIPVKHIIEEAMNLSVMATEDKAALVAVGLDENLITELVSRAVSLRYAEMVWNATKGMCKVATKEWNTNKVGAVIFRNEMIHSFRFAYRNDAECSKKIREIDEGNSYPDMVQDLGNLALLGKENPAPLHLIKYDMAKIDIADELCVKMGELLAKVNGEKSNSSSKKIIRDQAYTFLNEASSTIREYGKFVFWKDEKKFKNYTSDYIRKHRNRKLSKPKENTAD